MATKKSNAKVAVYRVGAERVLEPILSYPAARSLIGGDLKECIIDGGPLVAFYNAEGRDIGLPFNRSIGNIPVVGNFYICRVNAEGETVGLTPSDLKFLEKHNL